MKYGKTQPTFTIQYLKKDMRMVNETWAVRGDALLRVAEVMDSGVTDKVVLETQEIFEKE
jgi:hypothetical protein